MTPDNSHPVDDAIRRLVGDPEPDQLQRQLGDQRLRRLIDQESRGPHRSLLQRGAVMAGLALLVVFLAVWLRPTPTEAATEQLATAIETVDPVSLPPNQYLYTRSSVTLLAIVPADALGEIAFSRSHLAYLLSSTRETWMASDGSMQLRTTNLLPHFFSSDAEAAYFEARLDQMDQLGVPQTETFLRPDNPGHWPDDIHALDAAIRSQIQDDGDPERVQYLNLTLGILRENLISPQLRANTIRLIGRQPDIAVGQDENGLVVATTYTDQGILTRLAFSVDPSGNLAREEVTILGANDLLGIPTGTSTFLAVYERGEFVSDLTSP